MRIFMPDEVQIRQDGMFVSPVLPNLKFGSGEYEHL
jgi:hypothetical protein